MLLLIAVSLTVMGLGIGVILYGKKGKRDKNSAKLDAFFYQLYFEFRKAPIIKSYIKKMTIQLQKLSVFTKREVCIKAAKYFLFTATITTGAIVAALFLFDDPVSILLGAALAYILPTTMIEKRIARINYSVYFQMKYAVESLRLEYLRCNNVVEALENVNCGKRLTGIFDALHQVLVSANGELKLKEFYELTPFRPIQTLAQVCYHINNTGDEEDIYGKSSFVEALLVMTSDLNQELERLCYRRIKFGKIEYLCLIPIPAIKLIENFLSVNMPGTVLIYKGPMGYVIRVMIILTSLVSYTIISRINNSSSLKQDDRLPFFSHMVRSKFVYGLILNIAPKNAKRRKLIKRLHNAFSKKTIEEFYLEKLSCSVSIFLLLILTLISGIAIGRNCMLNTVQTLSMVKNDDLASYKKEDILGMDNKYIAMRRMDYVFEEEELNTFILESLPGLSDLQITDQVARLEKKYKQLECLYFRWYFIPICFFVALIGWWVPDWFLKMRMTTLKEEEEEEFLQIQTLMIILMSMNCDTMEAIEYLSQLTRVHREMFLYCYHSYAANPIAALEDMQRKTPIPDFQRFIGKLKLTVDELSLNDAFSDLKMDREHICRERDMVLRDIIDVKRMRCGKLATVGFVMTIMLLFMFPLLYMGFQEMMGGISKLQGL